MSAGARLLTVVLLVTIASTPIVSFSDGSSLWGSHEHDSRCSICHACQNPSLPAPAPVGTAALLLDHGPAAEGDDFANDAPAAASSASRAPPSSRAS